MTEEVKSRDTDNLRFVANQLREHVGEAVSFHPSCADLFDRIANQHEWAMYHAAICEDELKRKDWHVLCALIAVVVMAIAMFIIVMVK